MKTSNRTRVIAAFVAAIATVLFAGAAMARFYVVSVPASGGSKNTVIVSHSGSDTESGAALLAALTAITGESPTNRYLIVIEPGAYDIGGNFLQMKSYVDITGYGEDAVTITGNIDGDDTGVVKGADNAALLRLTVTNTGGGTDAIAIYNDGSSPTLTHVKATASGGGGKNIGVANYGSSPKMTSVTAEAIGGNEGYGVYNNASSPTMIDVTASASLANSANYGVHNTFNASPKMMYVTASATGDYGTKYGVANIFLSDAEMNNVTIEASGVNINYGVYNVGSGPPMTNVNAEASGGSYNYGVYNYDNASPPMSYVTATASGGNNNYGVYNDNASPTMTNVTAEATGGTIGYGVHQINGAVEITHSEITGDTNSVYITDGAIATVTRTRLYGETTINPNSTGAITCKCVCDENDTCYTDTCP